MSSGATPACGRSMTTARPTPRRSRATTYCVSTATRAARRCCRCLAARSPPTGGLPSMRSRNWRPGSPAWARPGPRARPCPAATSRAATWRASRNNWRSAIRSCRNALLRALARRHGALAYDVLGNAASVGGPRRAFRRRTLRAGSGLSARARMGGERRGRAVAPHQGRPAPRRRARTARSATLADAIRPCEPQNCMLT